MMPNPPKVDPVRRNARVGPLLLPADGRQGDPPPWPLPGRPNSAERDAWAQLWATPQAVAWEQQGWTRTVARYCRVMVEAEKRESSPAILAQAVALEDRLGLTPKSMRLLLWQIATDEVAEKRQESAGVRGRIRAVS